jgi:hypothetical protein
VYTLYIQQNAVLQSLFYLEIALHVSGGTTTHHQECKQLYLQHLVFVTPLLLPAAIMEVLERDLSVLWVTYANHSTLKTDSNSSTIAAGSSSGVTNTRCCRYSCFYS